MRREERHHLKDNPLATALTRVQSALLVQGRTLAVAGAVVIVALAGVGGYFAWQQQRASEAGELLADALIVLGSRVADAPRGRGRYRRVCRGVGAAGRLLPDGRSAARSGIGTP